MHKKYIVEFTVVPKDTDTILYNRACKSFIAFTDTGLIYYVDSIYDLKNNIENTLKSYVELSNEIGSISEINLNSFTVTISELKGINLSIPNLISLNDIMPGGISLVCENFPLENIDTI